MSQFKVGDRVETCGGGRGTIIKADVGTFRDRWLVRWDDIVPANDIVLHERGGRRGIEGGLSQMPTQDIQVIGVLDLIVEALDQTADASDDVFRSSTHRR